MENEMKNEVRSEMEEYVTFHVTARDGSDVELAVVDEFNFEHKQYVAGARIENDAIVEEGVYIYRCKVLDDDFTVEKIENADEYQKVAEAYMNMDI